MSGPITTINPATEEKIATYTRMSDEEVAQAIEACHEAFEKWRFVSPEERAATIRAIGQTLRDNREELAALIPDSRLVALASNNHLLTATEPAWRVFCDEVRAFLAD